MTLDEAIIHCEEIARDCEYFCNSPSDEISERRHKCAKDLRQLVEWLKELKRYRELFNSPEEAEEMLDETSMV